jgi:hypothetical protein
MMPELFVLRDVLEADLAEDAHRFLTTAMPADWWYASSTRSAFSGAGTESARLLAPGFPPEASDGHEGPHNAPDSQHNQMPPVEIGVMGKGTDERLIERSQWQG